MTATSLRDPDLAALTGALGLRHAATPEEWRRNTLERLGARHFDQLQAARASLANNPASEAEFYQLITADPPLTLAMLEGRLGYYDAILPILSETVREFPHARIVDLGSYAGLVSLYLAKRFPDAAVTGIDRCDGAVRIARASLESAGISNVEFVQGDYTHFAPSNPFDLVVCLTTVPTYLLPQIPSESPERFERGKNLEAAAADPAFPGRPVAAALSAVRRLAGRAGRALLLERLADVSRVSLFLYLTAQAELRVERVCMLRWQTANEREGVQRAPLFVAAPHNGHAPCDEASLIDLLLPAPTSIDPLQLGAVQPAALTGADAQWCFEALPGPRDEVCVRGSFKDRHRFHIHLGVVGGARAYVYTCATSDYRELKICDVRFAGMLFAPVVDQLAWKQNAGEIFAAAPDPRALRGILREKFAAFGTFS